jgi:hypothetical protein
LLIVFMIFSYSVENFDFGARFLPSHFRSLNKISQQTISLMTWIRSNAMRSSLGRFFYKGLYFHVRPLYIITLQ